MKYEIKFYNFLLLKEEEHKKLLEIRNSDYIRLKMKNTNIIELKNHLKFIKNLKKSKKDIYYAVFDSENIVGSINITDIDGQDCFWGIYFKKNINPLISSLCTYIIIDKIFNELNIENLYLEVAKENISAYRFDLSFGFKVCAKSEKNEGKYYNMHMNKQYWNRNKDSGILAIIKRKINKLNYEIIEG